MGTRKANNLYRPLTVSVSVSVSGFWMVDPLLAGIPGSPAAIYHFLMDAAGEAVQSCRVQSERMKNESKGLQETSLPANPLSDWSKDQSATPGGSQLGLDHFNQFVKGTQLIINLQVVVNTLANELAEHFQLYKCLCLVSLICCGSELILIAIVKIFIGFSFPMKKSRVHGYLLYVY